MQARDVSAGAEPSGALPAADGTHGPLVIGTRVVDGIPPDERDQLVESYDGGFAEAIATGSDGRRPMTPLQRASLERLTALLDALPVGDLSDKVCVDYGVGARGFGDAYPKLRECAYAIGMDVSRVALEASARISADGVW